MFTALLLLICCAASCAGGLIPTLPLLGGAPLFLPLPDERLADDWAAAAASSSAVCVLGASVEAAQLSSASPPPSPPGFACRAPAGAPGFVRVRLSLNGGADVEEAGAVEAQYREAPSLRSAQPEALPAAGGALVWLSGAGLQPADGCVWAAGAAARGAFASSALLACESPAASEGPLRLSAQRAAAALWLEAVAAPRAVAAARGGEAGGARVALAGGPFPPQLPRLRCRFRAVAVAAAQRSSAAELACVAPALAPGAAALAVSADGGSSFWPAGAFEADQPPQLLGAAPPAAAAAGGARLALLLSAPPPPPPIACWFAGRGAASAPAAGAACAAPAFPPGFAALSLGAEAAWGGGGGAQLLFQTPPLCRAALPAAAAPAGRVALLGAHLGLGGGARTLRFGELFDSNARFVSTALLQAEAPAAPPGPLPLTAAAAPAPARFALLPPLAAAAAQPASGGVRGGEPVRLSGAGFGAGERLGCRFGTIGPLEAEVLGDEALRCVSPAHATGAAVPLGVSREGGLDVVWGAPPASLTFEY